MKTAVKVGPKGQVTIPQHLREQFGIKPAMLIEFEVVQGQLVIKVADEARLEAARQRISKMWGRRPGLSTEEIMILTRGEDWNKAEPS